MIIGDQRFSIKFWLFEKRYMFSRREGCLCADVLAKPYQDGYYKDFT